MFICSPTSPAAIPKHSEGNTRQFGGGLAQTWKAFGPRGASDRAHVWETWKRLDVRSAGPVCSAAGLPGHMAARSRRVRLGQHLELQPRVSVQRPCGVSPLPFTTQAAQWDVFSSRSQPKPLEDLPGGRSVASGHLLLGCELLSEGRTKKNGAVPLAGAACWSKLPAPWGACLRLVSSTDHAAHRAAAKEFQNLQRSSEEQTFLLLKYEVPRS